MIKVPSIEKKSDNLISVCFSDFDNTTSKDKILSLFNRLRDELNQHYRFWEILILLDKENEQVFSKLPQDLNSYNIRLIKVRGDVEFYKKRTIIAEEAIGDCVVLTTLNEVDYFDMIDMIKKSIHENVIIQVYPQEPMDKRSLFKNMTGKLSQYSGYNLNAIDFQSIAYPRNQLNYLLSHSEKELALRFPPLGEGCVIRAITARSFKEPENRLNNFSRRVVLLEKLLVSFSPKLLMIVTIVSGLLVPISLFYSIYAILVYLFLSSVEAGWLTISLMMSMLGIFLGASIFGLSLGLQFVIGRMTVLNNDALVMEEVNSVNLFKKVENELNIEINAKDVTPLMKLT